MSRRFVFVTVCVGALALAAVGATASTIDPVTRSVATSAFELQFSATNPEHVTSIRWNGSDNLTATGPDLCNGPLEYFGNSWATPDSADFKSLVGWGQTGTLAAGGGNAVAIDSASSNCYGSLGIPITTTYRFWDTGPNANRIKVSRSFDFRDTPLLQDFRPFIPRLSPLESFPAVYYPDASGTVLEMVDAGDCPFGCQFSDWNDSWFAMHDPDSGRGLIVRQAPGDYAVDLWVDNDGDTDANASGVLLVAPSDGFVAKVQTTTFLCFYDDTIWTPGLSLPPGC